MNSYTLTAQSPGKLPRAYRGLTFTLKNGKGVEFFERGAERYNFLVAQLEQGADERLKNETVRLHQADAEGPDKFVTLTLGEILEALTKGEEK